MSRPCGKELQSLRDTSDLPRRCSIPQYRQKSENSVYVITLLYLKNVLFFLVSLCLTPFPTTEIHIRNRNYFKHIRNFPAGNYMFKVNNRNTRTRCEICSKLTIKTPERS